MQIITSIFSKCNLNIFDLFDVLIRPTIEPVFDPTGNYFMLINIDAIGFDQRQRGRQPDRHAQN